MLDHEAIRKAYPNALTIDDGTGAFDSSGNKITLEQSKIDAARTELAKEDYKWKRAAEFPSYGEQLDYIYHHGVAKWKTDIVQPVKDKFPKP